MRQTWIVARREYLERVKTRGFIIATIALPLLLIGMTALSGFLGSRVANADRQMALIDYTGRIGDEVISRAAAFGYEIDPVDPATNLDDLDQRVLDNDLEGYLIIDAETLADGIFTFRSEESPGRARQALLEDAVLETVITLQLSAGPGSSGTGALRTLIEGGSLQFESLLDEGEAEEAGIRRAMSTGIGVAGAVLLYFAILLYGAYVLRAVLDEKRNRVVEVVISSVTPGRLMLGKILGVGSMGLTQMGIWIGSFVLLALFALPFASAVIPEEIAGELLQFLPGPGALVLLGVYFVLGYFLFASLFAAVGAMSGTEEEAQQAQFPVVMLLIVPFMMQMFTIAGSPPWMNWVALFPYFSPIMMFPRAVAETVPVWMVALSMVLMVLALVGTAWVAGRIYRVGILMQGKRPTLRDLIRWVRTT